MGFEPSASIENPEVTDSTKRQNRQNRYNRRSEVHGGYTGHPADQSDHGSAAKSPGPRRRLGRPGKATGTPDSTQRVALYLRASTAKRTQTVDGEDYRQRPEIQEERLRRLCQQRGWAVVEVYTDRASGRKESRPQLNRLMEDARRGLFDVVAVAAFDRFARSVKHLVLALDEFRHLNVQFFSLREAIDTGTPMGKAMFTIVGAMAELESALISERTVAAMHYAKEHGTRSGKRVGRQRRVFRRDIAWELRQRGLSYREIARQLGVPVATLHAGLKEYARGRSERASATDRPRRGKQGKVSDPQPVQQGGPCGTPEEGGGA